MSTPTSKELALESEVQRLRERIDLLERGNVQQREMCEAVLTAAHDEAVIQKNRLEAILEALPVGVALVDAQGGNIECNAAFEQVWGGPRPETRSIEDYAAYKAWWTDTGNPVRPEEWASARAVQAGETIVNQEMLIERFDGTRAFVLNSAAPIRDAQGRIYGSAVAILNITNLKEAEEKFSTLFRLSPISITVSDLNDGDRFLEVNDAFEKFTGHTRENVIGKTYPPDWLWADAQEYAQAVAQFTSSEQLNGFEFCFRHTSGETRNGQLWARSIDFAGKPCVLAMTIDITERKRAEAALRESEERLALAQNAARLGVWDCDLRTNTTAFSGEYARLYGLHPDHPPLPHEEWLHLVHPSDRERVEILLRKSIEDTHSWDAEFRVVWPDGSTHWLLGKGEVFLDESGTAVRMAGVNLDITDRKQAETALCESRATIERQLHEMEAVYRAAPVGLAVLNADLRWVRMNSRMADIDGFSVEEHLGRSILEALPDIAPQIEPLLRSVLQSGEPIWDREIRCTMPAQAGAERTWLASYYPLKEPDGRTVGINSVVQEITERKRAEAALAESEERFRNMADSAPVIIFQSDADGSATFFNRQATTFTGRTFEQLVGYGWVEAIHADDRERIMAAHRASLEEPVTGQEEVRLRRSDGQYRWMLVTSSPRFAGGQFAGYIGLIVDITDLKRTQEEAFASQKLESVGRLAGGIAHDFNNLLGGVLAQADLALADMAAGVGPEEELNNIRNVAIRGAGIVRQLMIYAGKESAISEPVDVSSLIDDMRDLLKVIVSKHVVLSTELSRDLPAVQANPAQLRQVVMNLVTNGSEAIGEHDGQVAIRTARSKAVPEPRGDAREWLELEVSDTGCGISRDVQANIFDPFFTTKFAGHGLGLAVVQRIVKGLGGHIQVESDPGRGSTFRITLPSMSNLVSPMRQIVSRPAPTELDRAATILVVEDENPLRQAVVKMLYKTGFEVLEAANGSTAVDVLHAKGGQIDLMLLDMTIPGASAQQIVAEAAKARPDIRVITTSAYSEEMVAHQIHASQIRGFIRKPFRLADLLQQLRTSLSS